MKRPKNQHQQVLWYLYHYRRFSLKDVINHSMFYKFQTRLSDIELKHGTITKKEKVSFTNTFGNKGAYNLHSPIVSREKLIELFNKYN